MILKEREVAFLSPSNMPSTIESFNQRENKVWVSKQETEAPLTAIFASYTLTHHQLQIFRKHSGYFDEHRK